jgi:hypothetical protein
MYRLRDRVMDEERRRGRGRGRRRKFSPVSQVFHKYVHHKATYSSSPHISKA